MSKRFKKHMEEQYDNSKLGGVTSADWLEWYLFVRYPTCPNLQSDFTDLMKDRRFIWALDCGAVIQRFKNQSLRAA